MFIDYGSIILPGAEIGNPATIVGKTSELIGKKKGYFSDGTSIFKYHHSNL